MQKETERAKSALASLNSNCSREEWVKIGMAYHAAGGDFEDFDAWSKSADSYNAQASKATWRSFKSVPGGVGAGTLFGMARDNGWRDANNTTIATTHRVTKSEIRKQNTLSASEIYSRCAPASNSHDYIQKKQAAGSPLDGLRVVPADDPLKILDESMSGALVVPVVDSNGLLSSLHFIVTDESAERMKKDGKPSKVNLPKHKIDGIYVVGEIKNGRSCYIVEGLGQAWACWQATNDAAVVCFGAGNMSKAVRSLQKKYPTTKLVVVPDSGKEYAASKIQDEMNVAVAYMPEGEENNFDASDLLLRDGADVLARLLESATMPPVSYPVSVAFADELPDQFDPPDELLEGVLTSGDGSVLYGDSNSGKTFLVIDMAASVARGVPWMGRRTEPGMVVYLAAESPASVRGRLQAYQKHNGCKVPNFAIVQSPIDLFDGDADTDRVITLVQQLERQRGQKVRLIVGDTLARLSAGANENAGQDMGLVVRRFDRIRIECKAHFLLIHHSGKSAEAGARGWSGIRAAVDTELEVSDSPQGRCVEITKQRDLSTKGERIGFRLEVVTLGHTKWCEVATSCVVVAADAPEKKKGKRISETDGAVLEFLVQRKTGIKKIEVVKHFEGRYEKGPVYRSLKTLVIAGAVHEAAGMVAAAGAAK